MHKMSPQHRLYMDIGNFFDDHGGEIVSANEAAMNQGVLSFRFTEKLCLPNIRTLTIHSDRLPTTTTGSFFGEEEIELRPDYIGREVTRATKFDAEDASRWIRFFLKRGERDIYRQIEIDHLGETSECVRTGIERGHGVPYTLVASAEATPVVVCSDHLRHPERSFSTRGNVALKSNYDCLSILAENGYPIHEVTEDEAEFVSSALRLLSEDPIGDYTVSDDIAQFYCIRSYSELPTGDMYIRN